MAKWAIVLWWATVPAASLASAVIGSWVVDREIPVIQVSNIVVTKEVQKGGAVITAHEVYRKRLCPVKIERTFLDGAGIRWVTPDIDFNSIGPLGPDNYKQATQLPVNISAGPAKLVMTLTWTCNPVQHLMPLTLVLPPFEFTVKP